MAHVKIASCPATRTFVRWEFCVACEQHVPGVGCPNLNRVVPKPYCLSECQYNKAGRCESPKEVERDDEPRELAEVWDSEAPLCAYPRQIKAGVMTEV